MSQECCRCTTPRYKPLMPPAGVPASGEHTSRRARRNHHHKDTIFMVVHQIFLCKTKEFCCGCLILFTNKELIILIMIGISQHFSISFTSPLDVFSICLIGKSQHCSTSFTPRLGERIVHPIGKSQQFRYLPPVAARTVTLDLLAKANIFKYLLPCSAQPTCFQRYPGKKDNKRTDRAQQKDDGRLDFLVFLHRFGGRLLHHQRLSSPSSKRPSGGASSPAACEKSGLGFRGICGRRYPPYPSPP